MTNKKITSYHKNKKIYILQEKSLLLLTKNIKLIIFKLFFIKKNLIKKEQKKFIILIFPQEKLTNFNNCKNLLKINVKL